jgi:GntR family transcriptional repressor for pyruvate dehydrogenase complex
MSNETRPQGRTSERVALRIREMLTDGRLKPGDKLPSERSLVATLGIGRPALREGLRMLEAGGLVEQRKGRAGGTFVGEGDPRSVCRTMQDLLVLGQISLQQLTEARGWIQEVVVRVACERATEEDMLALERNVNAAQGAFERGDLAVQSELNIEFHNILARSTHNPLLTINVRTITDVLRGFSRRMGPDPTGASFKLRRDLIGALRSRDEQQAASAMQAILRRAQRLYTELAQHMVPVASLNRRIGKAAPGGTARKRKA